MVQTALGNWFPAAQIDGRIEHAPLSATLWRIDDDRVMQSAVATPPSTLFLCAHLAGSMSWHARLDDREITTPVRPRTFCIARPGDRGEVMYAQAHCTFMHIHLDVARLRDLVGRDGIDFDGLELIDPANAIDGEVDRIARQIARAIPEGATTRLRLDSAALALTAVLIERWSNLAGQRLIPVDPRPDDWRVRHVIDLIDCSLDRDWGLAELAAMVDLSAAQLVRLFRAGTGHTPHAWVLRRRIDRACRALDNPRQSITEIAMALGFSSSQHFATVFRRHLGVSPTAYRAERLA
jgi:AraC family transcriptional regulator